MWERAQENIKNPDPNARCFPDAFPCVVYMNGDFYGLYSWQLKKHRKNMNLKKNNSEHIHLHGFMNNNFFNGAIEWDRIEVKNPKNLYDMDGKPYDDYAELIDETSPYYNLETDDKDTRKIKETSAKVKSSILNLTHYCGQLKTLVATGASNEEVRAAIEERFDVTSLCDYIMMPTLGCLCSCQKGDYLSAGKHLPTMRGVQSLISMGSALTWASSVVIRAVTTQALACWGLSRSKMKLPML